MIMAKAGASSFGKIFDFKGEYFVIQYMNNRKYKKYKLTFKLDRRY